MTRQSVLDQALALSPQERVELAMEIWDSVIDADDVPLTDEQKAELDRRLEEHLANPEAAIPWEKALKELEDEL